VLELDQNDGLDARATTPAVNQVAEIAWHVATVVLAQFLFTYLSPMQTIFGTRPVAVLDGLAIVGLGVVLLLAVEAGKRIRRWLTSTALTK
jgi:hypothetical protein